MSRDIDGDIEEALSLLEKKQTKKEKDEPNNMVTLFKQMMEANKNLNEQLSLTLNHFSEITPAPEFNINILSEKDMKILSKKVALELSAIKQNHTPNENIYKDKKGMKFFNNIPFATKALVGIISLLCIYLLLKFNGLIQKDKTLDIPAGVNITCNNKSMEIYKPLRNIPGMIVKNMYYFQLKMNNQSLNCKYKFKD